MLQLSRTLRWGGLFLILVGSSLFIPRPFPTLTRTVLEFFEPSLTLSQIGQDMIEGGAVLVGLSLVIFVSGGERRGE